MNLTTIASKLAGKKTYLVATVTAIFNLLLVCDIISLSPEQIIAMEGVFGSLLSTTIRLGIK